MQIKKLFIMFSSHMKPKNKKVTFSLIFMDTKGIGFVYGIFMKFGETLSILYVNYLEKRQDSEALPLARYSNN